ncbi:MAG: Trk system potassium transporter TrkA [Litorivicinus sp.]
MKIVILGAGQVGATLADRLAFEQHDITLVDKSRLRFKSLPDLDVRTVVGHASSPSTLEAAGVDDAELVIAVTNSDEVNLVACQLARALFRTPSLIARVRNSEYLTSDIEARVFQPDEAWTDTSHAKLGRLWVQERISPEAEVTDYIVKLLGQPGTLQVSDFAGGRAQMVCVKAVSGGPLVGHRLVDLTDHLPDVDTRVAAIYRRDRPIIPEGNTIIEHDDEVFFIANRKDISAVTAELMETDKPYRRILIAGGGNIGSRLASRLEGKYRVQLIERDANKNRELSERLNKTVVNTGDASSPKLLEECGIQDTDVFCAVTNSDEANIMASMLAKKMGARKVMTLINNAAYVDLVQGGLIDIAVSPEQATIGSILRHVRRGEILQAFSLRRGAAEALELVAVGDAKSSKVIGKTIDNINLPDGATIGAVVRGEQVLMGHNYIVIEPNDHVIVFLAEKSQRKLNDIERMFQPSTDFLL